MRDMYDFYRSAALVLHEGFGGGPVEKLQHSCMSVTAMRPYPAQFVGKLWLPDYTRPLGLRSPTEAFALLKQLHRHMLAGGMFVWADLAKCVVHPGNEGRLYPWLGIPKQMRAWPLPCVIARTLDSLQYLGARQCPAVAGEFSVNFMGTVLKVTPSSFSFGEDVVYFPKYRIPADILAAPNVELVDSPYAGLLAKASSKSSKRNASALLTCLAQIYPSEVDYELFARAFYDHFKPEYFLRFVLDVKSGQGPLQEQELRHALRDKYLDRYEYEQVVKLIDFNAPDMRQVIVDLLMRVRGVSGLLGLAPFLIKQLETLNESTVETPCHC